MIIFDQLNKESGFSFFQTMDFQVLNLEGATIVVSFCCITNMFKMQCLKNHHDFVGQPFGQSSARRFSLIELDSQLLGQLEMIGLWVASSQLAYLFVPRFLSHFSRRLDYACCVMMAVFQERVRRSRYSFGGFRFRTAQRRLNQIIMVKIKSKYA